MQSRFGDKLLRLRPVCPRNGTALLTRGFKGFDEESIKPCSTLFNFPKFQYLPSFPKFYFFFSEGIFSPPFYQQQPLAVIDTYLVYIFLALLLHLHDMRAVTYATYEYHHTCSAASGRRYGGPPRYCAYNTPLAHTYPGHPPGFQFNWRHPPKRGTPYQILQVLTS